ncbi:MAG: hypothetical protein J6O51_09640 [Bacteroidales bacterium]|nr:hypothetical protein [Bacteroidales bacterium]
MKKIFAAMGLMMAAIISLVSCQPKELVSEPGRTMTIYASSELTKTTNDGLSTLWAEGDQLHVFYLDPSVATHASYVKAGVFTISEGVGTKSGTFTGEAASTPSAATTWYAIYTGASAAAPETPDASSEGDGFVYIGRSNGLSQTAYDDMSKVSGSHCPMYGVAANVAADQAPGFTMKQIASVIEFNVVNTGNQPISISSLQLNELTDIAGQFYVDVTGDEPVFTPVEGKTIANPEVIISNPSELNAGAAAKLYMPVKPFVHGATAGMEVKVSGSANGKVGSTTVALYPKTEAQGTFSAGKIKKVTVEVAGFDAAQTSTISDFIAANKGEEFVIADAIVTLVYSKGFFVQDNTGTLWVSMGAAPTVSKGDAVTLSGERNEYSGVPEMYKPVVTVTSSGNSVELNPEAWGFSQVSAALDSPTTKYVSLSSVEFSSKTAATLAGTDSQSTVSLSVYAATDPEVTLAKGTYNVTGYICGAYNGKVYLYVDSAEKAQEQEASLELSPATITFTQDGGSENVTVTSDNNNWTVDETTVAEWLTVSRASSFVGLIVSTAANTGSKRSASVKIKHSNGTLVKTLKVTQEGPLESDSISLSPSSFTFEAQPEGPITITVTSNNDGWTIDEATVESWLTLSRSGNTVTVTAQANTGEARNCTVKFHHANGTPNANLVINQRAPSSGNKVTYTKVTSGTIGTGDYLIVFEESGKAFDGSLTDFAKQNYKDVTISGNTITMDEGSHIHYDASAKTVQTASGYYIGAKGNNSNGISSSKTLPSSSNLYTISISVNGGVASIGCSLDAGVHALRFNTEYNYFRFYKPSSSLATELAIYKKN